MSSGRMVSWLLCGACVAICGCERRERSPVAPDPRGVSVAARGVAALALGGGQASGHAFLHGTTVQNVRDEALSFTAATDPAFPQARGELEVHGLQFTGEEFRVHAEVICMAVEGNVAWVGARITQLVFDGQKLPDRVGRPVIFRVVDGGEGEGAADVASLLFFAGPGKQVQTAESYCETAPNFPILRTIEEGNIQVESR